MTATANTPALSNPSNALTTLQDQIKKLDDFAASNSLGAILENAHGQFGAAIAIASAMDQLRELITADVMKPIMKLQGSPLGFRTDKDKSGGYPEPVVKEAFIEATLKGFKMVANQSNIIGGRWYPTKEGFESFFRNLPQFTDLKLSPGIPKTTSDGCIVIYSASWTYKGIKGEIRDLPIPIRVNEGQGPDAILGKAKRKMLAAIYSRVTGTEITDGDVDDATVAGAKPAEKVESGSASGQSEELKQLYADLEKMLSPHEELANAYLIAASAIQKGQTFRNVSEAMARKIIKQADSFLTAIGAK